MSCGVVRAGRRLAAWRFGSARPFRHGGHVRLVRVVHVARVIDVGRARRTSATTAAGIHVVVTGRGSLLQLGERGFAAASRGQMQVSHRNRGPCHGQTHATRFASSSCSFSSRATGSVRS